MPTITNPERIRALAHPVRLELLDFLRSVDDATATRCAEAVGESVASCSFHLHTLAKYGYIEAAPRRGRERPWRVVVTDVDMRPDENVPGSTQAVAEIAALHLDRNAARVRRYLASLTAEPDAWAQASTVTSSTFWATAEELADLSRVLQTIAVERFGGRTDDPSQRPEGARRSVLFATVNPEPAVDPESAGESS